MGECLLHQKIRVEDVTVTSNTSWLLRKILKARELIVRIGGWETVSNQWKFSIKTAYKLLQANYDNVVWKRLVCNNQATPKSKFILWLALLNRLATAERVSKWSWELSPLCKLCGTDIENVQHLFFNCQYSNTVWCNVLRYLNLQPQGTAQQDMEMAIRKARSTKDRSKLFVMMYTESVYSIWLQRNAKYFRDSDVNPNDLARNIILRVAVICSEKQKQMLVM
ncbi:uncharacterized protein LOC130589491 [Beta vulgaris subsp. vulgaris]|uniref:uncharacterized protein LOC130589491 n=1 Tax=Beta vulgaris subsp. vulgaris TaxID=3555 RepID=UPI00254731FA|nr:uncharacterized protein LOC130589491 [Beta vulgaris subsp. vulgaris]